MEAKKVFYINYNKNNRKIFKLASTIKQVQIEIYFDIFVEDL